MVAYGAETMNSFCKDVAMSKASKQFLTASIGILAGVTTGLLGAPLSWVPAIGGSLATMGIAESCEEKKEKSSIWMNYIGTVTLGVGLYHGVNNADLITQVDINDGRNDEVAVSFIENRLLLNMTRI